MITKLGLQKLEADLIALKQELEITFQKRGEAAAEGDLRENSAYIFMGERARVLGSQIAEIEADLASSVVQTPPKHTGYICFGHQVKIIFERDNREMEIVLVGKNDARLKPNWISCESPLGIALMGKRLNEVVMVNEQPVKIISINIAEI